MSTDKGTIYFGNRVDTGGESDGTGDRYKLRYDVQRGQLTWDYSDHTDIGDALCRAYADDGLEHQLEQARELYEGGPGDGEAIVMGGAVNLTFSDGTARIWPGGELLTADALRVLGRAAFEAAKMIGEAEAAKVAARTEIVG